MRTLTWLALLGLLALGLQSCKKPKPSLEYTEASGSYTTLVAQLGDDAYEDPQMDHIEDLLKRVPADSLDATAAAELLRTIAGEKRRLANEAVARGRASPTEVAVFDPPRPPEPQASPDAGASGELEPGMTFDEIKKVSDSCFAPTGPVKLRNPDRSETVAEMYERVDALRCRDRYSKYEGRFLVLRDGKLVGDFSKQALVQMVAPTAVPPAVAPPPAPEPVVEPGGDKPPTPQAPPPSPGEQTGSPPPAP